jgi:hypothetical protein
MSAASEIAVIQKQIADIRAQAAQQTTQQQDSQQQAPAAKLTPFQGMMQNWAARAPIRGLRAPGLGMAAVPAYQPPVHPSLANQPTQADPLATSRVHLEAVQRLLSTNAASRPTSIQHGQGFGLRRPK